METSNVEKPNLVWLQHMGYLLHTMNEAGEWQYVLTERGQRYFEEGV